MTPHKSHPPQPSADTSLSPLSVLNAARKAVPAMNYALAAAGLAGAGAIIVAFLGNRLSTVVVLGGTLVLMVLIFVFARLVATKSAATTLAGLVLMWMVIAFFGVLLALTTSAITFGVPAGLVQILGLPSGGQTLDRSAMERLIQVPKELQTSILKGNLSQSIKLVRLQPRDRATYDDRDRVLRGAGAYYSFARETHEYGYGSDISLEQGALRTGFTTGEYGFLLNIGQGTIEELALLSVDSPPKSLEKARSEAWKYMWNYRPPTDATIKRDRDRARIGFAIGDVSISEQSIASKGATYLLRSVSFGRSDILVGFNVVEILGDSSVILAWRILKVFDTPIDPPNN